MESDRPDLSIKDLLNPPPVMHWRAFADWVRMSNEHDVVWGWIRNGHLPSVKVGKYVMVNVALLTQQLLDGESLR
jgi:hypothetical protein